MVRIFLKLINNENLMCVFIEGKKFIKIFRLPDNLLTTSAASKGWGLLAVIIRSNTKTVKTFLKTIIKLSTKCFDAVIPSLPNV